VHGGEEWKRVSSERMGPSDWGEWRLGAWDRECGLGDRALSERVEELGEPPMLGELWVTTVAEGTRACRPGMYLLFKADITLLKRKKTTCEMEFLMMIYVQNTLCQHYASSSMEDHQKTPYR